MWHSKVEFSSVIDIDALEERLECGGGQGAGGVLSAVVNKVWGK
jgi:hypothetical protein